MTLLLGPPGSGKTTMLLALSGKLDSTLKVSYPKNLLIRFCKRFLMCLIVCSCQVSGKVTYNGHDMDEFVPQRTSAYIGQHDLHIGEMTVRETLAFSARCQGVGTRYGT